jgi:hypothetical protein
LRFCHHHDLQPFATATCQFVGINTRVARVWGSVAIWKSARMNLSGSGCHPEM